MLYDRIQVIIVPELKSHRALPEYVINGFGFAANATARIYINAYVI